MLTTISIEQPSLLFAIYFGYFLISILFSFLLNKVLLKFSSNLGIRNHDVTIIRWSETSKPAFGGIGFFIAFLISGSIYSILFDSGTDVYNKELLGIVTASSLAFIMGLADDAYNTKPLLKFGAQISCGLILVFTGTYISLFPNDIANYILTVFWVVGMMNSINMLDNMDGITTTVSIFTLLASILAIFLCTEDYTNFHMLVLLGVLGSLVGFLFFNWHPSKMFMGDTGSQFLGVFLAAIGIIYFWNNKGDAGDEAHTRQIVITLLAFIMPIIDTTTVTINRLRKGIPPYIGGKDHTTHHLSYLGYSDHKIGLIFGGISLASLVLIFIIIKVIPQWEYWHAGIFFVYFLIIFGVLYRNTLSSKPPEKENIEMP
ncbi:MAG: undecaprenyl/decaprenyl-phosphate alpha-N-acetylglucosaminyl 1-phosphate transferase [Flavobacteriales bacterium]|nr:undecaprenyl/decaprenyl-phosphate alpha-N-acetylglucosaminyl 1-phosphate transferase [Flavobacteriales bacterium]